jgi:hypothetical protein
MKSQEKKPRKKRQAKGLGDTVENVLKLTGIKQAIELIAGKCDACEKRREALNKAFPYMQLNENKGVLRQDQKEAWEFFKEQNKKVLKDPEMDLIQQIYCEVFHTKVSPCRTCAGASLQWKTLIDRIDHVYEYSNKKA